MKINKSSLPKLNNQVQQMAIKNDKNKKRKANVNIGLMIEGRSKAI